MRSRTVRPPREEPPRRCGILHHGWLSSYEHGEDVFGSTRWMDRWISCEDWKELTRKSSSKRFKSYVYDLWSKATCLAGRVYSRGETESNRFMGKRLSKKTKSAHTGKVKSTGKMNGHFSKTDRSLRDWFHVE